MINRTKFIIVTCILSNLILYTNATQDNFPSNYKNVSNIIIKTAISTSKIENLEYMCDEFGARYRGTPALDNALNWVVSTMKSEGLENVHMEKVVNITNWIRGEEYLHMLTPRFHKMSILGLGKSVGTGNPIIGEVFVVSSFDDLKANADKAKGKIVLFNVAFTNYGQTVAYRAIGASEAAKVGAIAALVRSITPLSLYTPHTGEMFYEANVPQIPFAAVTIEDAEMMSRMQARGTKITVKFYMEAHYGDPVTSYNVIAELTGSEKPEEIILMGGHSDSWDVGQGAMDDGAGFWSAWDALRTISDLVKQGTIPRPKRTIRVILWVDEEISQQGAIQYAQTHKDELANHVIAIESDSGNFIPYGFGFTGSQEAFALLQQIGNVLLSPIGCGNITFNQGVDTDNGPLHDAGVPCGSLQSEGFVAPNGSPLDAFYFYYHHSNADTVTSLNRDGLRKSVASFAVFTYVIADMKETLPR